MRPQLIIRKILKDNHISQEQISGHLGMSQQCFSSKLHHDTKLSFYVDALKVLGFDLLVVDKDGRGYKVTNK